jgi:hypothetical protein
MPRYTNEQWKHVMANTLDDAEREGWFTTRLAILMVEGLLGADQTTAAKIREMRDYIYKTVLRERLNGYNDK